MADAPPRPPQALIACLVATILLCSLSSPALAKSSPRPITDSEIREKKNTCYADIESGLWGWKCKSSMIEKENCALRCLSPVCYELIYESDPLEEGEKDFIRAQEYKYCMHKWEVIGTALWHSMIFNKMKFMGPCRSHQQRVSLGERLDGVKGAFDY